MKRRNAGLYVKMTIICLSMMIQAKSQETPDSIKRKRDSELIFERAENSPSVDQEAMRKHFADKLKMIGKRKSNQGMIAGTYTVQVRFLVEKDGSLADISALNDPGFELGSLAVELIKTGPKWMPAKQNGRVVRCFHLYPVSFQVPE